MTTTEPAGLAHPLITQPLVIDVEGLDPTTVEEIKQAIATILARAEEGAHDPEAVGGWTSETAARLDGHLRSHGRRVQADVLGAASRADGYVTREQVYDIAGYGPERSLTGFRKPILTAMKRMIELGELPADAVVPLSSEYDIAVAGVQRALGFSMPADLVPVFRSAVG